MKHLPLTLAVLVALALPAGTAAQTTDARGVSVHAALGSHVNVGGNAQSLSVGFSPADRLTFLVGVERLHMPTAVEQHGDSLSVTRGGTTTFLSGEAQVIPVRLARLSPYLLAGAGAGRSRPNVNDRFPDPVSNSAALLFFGGGLRVPATTQLNFFADVRFTLQVEQEVGGVFLFVPLRGGVAWRF
jgi:hypothetical protein